MNIGTSSRTGSEAGARAADCSVKRNVVKPVKVVTAKGETTGRDQGNFYDALLHRRAAPPRRSRDISTTIICAKDIYNPWMATDISRRRSSGSQDERPGV